MLANEVVQLSNSGQREFTLEQGLAQKRDRIESSHDRQVTRLAEEFVWPPSGNRERVRAQNPPSTRCPFARTRCCREFVRNHSRDSACILLLDVSDAQMGLVAPMPCRSRKHILRRRRGFEASMPMTCRSGSPCWRIGRRSKAASPSASTASRMWRCGASPIDERFQGSDSDQALKLLIDVAKSGDYASLMLLSFVPWAERGTVLRAARIRQHRPHRGRRSNHEVAFAGEAK